MPAVLLAFLQGPQMVLWVILLYVVVQTAEAYLITPPAQCRITALPPVLVIASQILGGLLFGFLGLVLATPLLVVGLILVKRLYATFLAERMARFPGSPAMRWPAQWFRVQPSAVAAVVHPWRHLPPVRELDWEPRRLAFLLPATIPPAGATLSLEIAAPRRSNVYRFARARIGGRSVLLFPSGREGPSRRLVSERFPPPALDEAVTVPGMPRPERAWLWQWAPP